MLQYVSKQSYPFSKQNHNKIKTKSQQEQNIQSKQNKTVVILICSPENI